MNKATINTTDEPNQAQAMGSMGYQNGRAYIYSAADKKYVWDYPSTAGIDSIRRSYGFISHIINH